MLLKNLVLLDQFISHRFAEDSGDAEAGSGTIYELAKSPPVGAYGRQVFTGSLGITACDRVYIFRPHARCHLAAFRQLGCRLLIADDTGSELRASIDKRGGLLQYGALASDPRYPGPH